MKKPNVLLLYPDQMRYDSASFGGSSLSVTPALDTLAAQSACFDGAFTSFPLCCPFRASLMTGKYAHKAGMCTNHYPIPLEQSFLPKLMGESGYRTGWFGKWHLNGGKKFDFVPEEYQLGFHEFVGYSRGHHYIDSVYYRGSDPTPHKSPKYEPEYQTDHVIDFMERARNGGQPFLAMICYGLPHTPLDMAPDHYLNMYRPEDVVLPDDVPSWNREESREYIAKYYGLVRCVDDQIARLTDYLKNSGLWEDTIVVFVSDHGDMCGEYGLQYKSSYHAAAAHVPLLIRLPGAKANGTRIKRLVDPAVSLMPTLLELCGLPVPPEAQGESLAEMLRSEPDGSPGGEVYYQLLGVSEEACRVLDRQERKRYPERGLRTPELLYVEKCGVPFALYDLRIDPEERFNMVNCVDYLEVVEDMRSRLKDRMLSLEDDWSIQAEEPPPDYQSHASADDDYYSLYARATLE